MMYKIAAGLALYLVVGIAAINPTNTLLEDRCHPRIAREARTVSIVLWPVSILAAGTTLTRC